jgi:hypothetical protein
MENVLSANKAPQLLLSLLRSLVAVLCADRAHDDNPYRIRSLL